MGRRAPVAPITMRPNSLSETCSTKSSTSTIDIIPVSSSFMDNSLQSNGFSINNNARRSFHQNQTTESYAIYQNHLPVPSKLSTFNVNLPIENNLRRSSSPSRVPQIPQKPIIDHEKNHNGNLSNSSHITQQTYNQSISSISDSERSQPLNRASSSVIYHNNNTTSASSSVFARSRENGSTTSNRRRPSFANSSNFQRLSKLRMNFNRRVILIR